MAQTFSVTSGIYNTISNVQCSEKQKRILISFEMLLNTGTYGADPYICTTIPPEYAPKNTAPALAYGSKNSDNSSYIAIVYPDGNIRMVVNKTITGENNTIMFGTLYDID